MSDFKQSIKKDEMLYYLKCIHSILWAEHGLPKHGNLTPEILTINEVIKTIENLDVFAFYSEEKRKERNLRLYGMEEITKPIQK